MIRHRRPIGNNDDEGVSSALTAMFLIAMVMMVYASIMGFYMPKWAQADEYVHMKNIEGRFIEMQSTVNLELTYGLEGDTISVPVKMGSITKVKSMQIIELPSAAGSINFTQNDRFFSLEMTDDTDGSHVFTEYGSLQFAAFNTYYPQLQYIYQGDAVIKRQDSISTMVSQPNMEFFLTRGTINSNSTTTYYYDATTPDTTYAEEVVFNIPGRPGDITVTYQDNDISAGEVEVYLNSVDLGVQLAPQAAGSWSGDHTFTISDKDFLDGGMNTLVFRNIDNYNSGFPYLNTWGIRNVDVHSDFFRITMPAISLMGDDASIGGVGVATVTMKNMGSDHMSYRPGIKRNYTINLTSTTALKAWMKYYQDILQESDLTGADYQITQVDATHMTITFRNVDEISLDRGMLQVGLT